jgi:DNA-binding CsgD family transcriptional regulator
MAELAGDALERGRASYASRAWEDARASLVRVDRAAPLGADDLELLATSAYMVGRMDDFLSVLERAHHAQLDGGEPLRAVRCAFFLGVNLALRGEMGHAAGWFGRAQRLVEREGGDCVESGYLLMPVAMENEASGRYEAALAAAAAAAEVGERFGDADLFALAVHTQGLVLIRMGQTGEGLALLDQAMLSASAGELSPIITGVVYCGVIAGCEEAYEVRRAREWTGALSRWCADQPELVAFSGRCHAHRSEIMQLDGAWSEALDEARRARERAERAMNPAAAGQALYQQAEIQRLQGDFVGADGAYRDAHRYGREPQPGLALLRLAQGDAEAAAAAIRRALGETTEPLKRARLLPAAAEIMLACRAEAEARDAAVELMEIVARNDSLMLHAIVDHVRGTVELAEGDAQGALVSLRRAWRAWQELGAPYESARTRVLVGQACRMLGDADTAALELEAARSVFARLGAVTELAVVASLNRRDESRGTHGLTKRELDVLRLVAAGKSNREIAAELVVSEHTAARHVQNILAKLRVSSRTAATAFAFEHDLV